MEHFSPQAARVHAVIAFIMHSSHKVNPAHNVLGRPIRSQQLQNQIKEDLLNTVQILRTCIAILPFYTNDSSTSQNISLLYFLHHYICLELLFRFSFNIALSSEQHTSNLVILNVSNRQKDTFFLYDFLYTTLNNYQFVFSYWNIYLSTSSTTAHIINHTIHSLFK